MTLPLIGWTPVGVREKRWGFSVAKYGTQDQTECTATGGAFWCQSDAGQRLSRAASGSPATTRPIPRWRSTRPGSPTGSPTSGPRCAGSRSTTSPCCGRRPTSMSTRRRSSYDEIWSRTADIGAAVKTARPDAVIFGPVVWGWCAYFYSAADGCWPGRRPGRPRRPALSRVVSRSDLRARGEHRGSPGRRPRHSLLPAGRTGAARKRGTRVSRLCASVRSKTFTTRRYSSESWIGEPVRLIPRMRDLIDQHCPGSRSRRHRVQLGGGRHLVSAGPGRGAGDFRTRRCVCRHAVGGARAGDPGGGRLSAVSGLRRRRRSGHRHQPAGRQLERGRGRRLRGGVADR